MADRNFVQLLAARWADRKMVCVGLDSELAKIPAAGRLASLEGEQRRVAFNRAIIDATKDIACVFKPNSAFYEAQGDAGLRTLADTVRYIRETASNVPIILDAKRADIGNTNAGYVAAAFDDLGVDAITVHPYLGQEALAPFLEREDKGVIVLARTSNPGAGEFQDLQVGDDPLYLAVAERVAKEWNRNGNCGLVVGGTYPEEIGRVRERVGDIPFLIPGIGAQGGDLERTVKAGRDSQNAGMTINSSRGIVFASSGPDFAEAAGAAAAKLHEDIVAALG